MSESGLCVSVHNIFLYWDISLRRLVSRPRQGYEVSEIILNTSTRVQKRSKQLIPNSNISWGKSELANVLGAFGKQKEAYYDLLNLYELFGCYFQVMEWIKICCQKRKIKTATARLKPLCLLFIHYVMTWSTLFSHLKSRYFKVHCPCFCVCPSLIKKIPGVFFFLKKTCEIVYVLEDTRGPRCRMIKQTDSYTPDHLLLGSLHPRSDHKWGKSSKPAGR